MYGLFFCITLYIQQVRLSYHILSFCAITYIVSHNLAITHTILANSVAVNNYRYTMQYTLVGSSGHFNNNMRITGIYKTTTDSGLSAAAQNKTTRNISFDGIKQQQTTTRFTDDTTEK